MALERLIALALSDVREHLIVHLISSAVRDPAERSRNYTSQTETSGRNHSQRQRSRAARNK